MISPVLALRRRLISGPRSYGQVDANTQDQIRRERDWPTLRPHDARDDEGGEARRCKCEHRAARSEDGRTERGKLDVAPTQAASLRQGGGAGIVPARAEQPKANEMKAAMMLVDSRRHRDQDPEQAVDPGPSSGTRTLLTARRGRESSMTRTCEACGRRTATTFDAIIPTNVIAAWRPSRDGITAGTRNLRRPR